MAEGICLSGLAYNLLNTITGFASDNASQWSLSLSTWGAKHEFEELEKTIRTLVPVLRDADGKQQGSAEVKDRIFRLRWVLYDADDLFDEITANEMLKKQMPNPVISVATRVNAIRKRLEAISEETSRLELLRCENQIADLREGIKNRYSEESLLLYEGVIGRGKERDDILGFLQNCSGRVSVLAIVGIEGVGKTAIAREIYRDEEDFESRWWASMCDVSDEKEVLGRIFQCISNRYERYHGLTINRLQSEILEILHSAGRYLLVLDDVEDCDASLWLSILRLLCQGSNGSKIIVNTTSLSVAEAVCADQICELGLLTDEWSWRLFERFAFTHAPKKDLNWISLGRKILKKCVKVPLVIKSIATHLSANPGLKEWNSFYEKLRCLGYVDPIKPTLRLIQDDLSPVLKQCFAYCSLFPRDYVFHVEELTQLWSAQGYLKPMIQRDGENLEMIGCLCFRELWFRSFFGEVERDEYKEVFRCSRHTLKDLATDESIRITKESSHFHSNILHSSVGYSIGNSWSIPPSLLNAERLRSFLFLCEGSLSPLVLDTLLENFKLLRALNLGRQNIREVPSSIGELKHLRYLNLSHNIFTYLPDSITMLVNLVTLDISWCAKLELLPGEFRRLVNLKHLNTKECYRLRYMPQKFEELTSLQSLSFFKVVEATEASMLDSLANLELGGELEILFDDKINDGDVKGCWKLFQNLSGLIIKNYQGTGIPHLMRIISFSRHLVKLHVGPSSTIERLSTLGYLTQLKTLQLANLYELEYIDENEDVQSCGATTNDRVPFSQLSELTLERLPKLKAWSKQVEAGFASQSVAIPNLRKLTIRCCQKLKFIPRCPLLEQLELNDINEKLVQLYLCTSFYPCSSTVQSSGLAKSITIWDCNMLESFAGENLVLLKHLELRFCDKLKNVKLGKNSCLQELVIQSCPELELWEENGGVNWDYLPSLLKLTVIGMPLPENLPHGLQQIQAHGKLCINIEGQEEKTKELVDLARDGEGIDDNLAQDGPSNLKLKSKVQSKYTLDAHLVTYKLLKKANTSLHPQHI